MEGGLVDWALGGLHRVISPWMGSLASSWRATALIGRNLSGCFWLEPSENAFALINQTTQHFGTLESLIPQVPCLCINQVGFRGRIVTKEKENHIDPIFSVASREYSRLGVYYFPLSPNLKEDKLSPGNRDMGRRFLLKAVLRNSVPSTHADAFISPPLAGQEKEDSMPKEGSVTGSTGIKPGIFHIWCKSWAKHVAGVHFVNQVLIYHLCRSS